MLSLFTHLHTPFPPFLISLNVSVDVKHHVYLLQALVYNTLPPTTATTDSTTGLEKNVS